MSKGLVQKLLVLAVGVLLVLIGLLFQLRQNSPSQTPKKLKSEDMATVLTSSLQQQRRSFQRCWLRVSGQQKNEDDQLTWQIFLVIQPSGKVKDFALINKTLFDAETEKCLKEISYRLRFPAFDGDDVSITVPIVISHINESH
jgi:hypothetical protein